PLPKVQRRIGPEGGPIGPWAGSGRTDRREAPPSLPPLWTIGPTLPRAHASPRGSHKEQPVLPLARPAVPAVGADDHVLFLRHLNRLAAPLGNRRGCLQLDRKPHRRDDAGFAAPDDAVLVVPEADERTGAVAIQANRMRVHRAVDALRLHASDHRRQDLVAGAAPPH